MANDLQTRSIRQALLKACAVCGPDAELTDSKYQSSKFLEFAKVTQEDQVFEGIQICIRWYAIVLESCALGDQTQNKGAANLKQTTKNVEIQKRLQATLEEIHRSTGQFVPQT